MSAPWKTDIVRTFLLSIWGLVTLVLVFLVMILVNQMLKSGQDPLDSLRTQPEAAPASQQAARPATALGQREVQLYFADAEGRYLTPQTVALDVTDSTIENCRNALKALILGPKQGGAPVIAPSVQVRALYLLEGGELVIDFSREFISEHARVKSATQEALLVQGVVATLAQGPLQSKGEPAVRRVRFLVEGSAPTETYPAHISLGEPVEPDTLWLTPEASAAPAPEPEPEPAGETAGNG
jgi:spore germination protein GerM